MSLRASATSPLKRREFRPPRMGESVEIPRFSSDLVGGLRFPWASIPSRRTTRVVGLGVLAHLAGMSLGWASLAGPVDPTSHVRAAVGRAAGPTAQQGQDGRHIASEATVLPSHPQVVWRTRISGNLEHALVIDRHGRIVVASTTAFTQLSPDGRHEASFELTASAVSPPILLSDGTRAVITADGYLVTATPLGRMSARRPLEIPVSQHTVLLVPSSDGGVALAVGQAVRWLTGSGTWRVAAPLSGTVVALFERRQALLAVTRAGDLIEWNGVDSPRRLASLGGTSEGGAALLHPDLLVAVVDQRRVVEVQLVTGARRVRVPDGPLLRLMAPGVTERGETRLVSADGLLLGHDAAGRETLRTSLGGPGEQTKDAGLPVSGPTGGMLVLGASNRLAYALPGLDPAVVGPEGVTPIQGAGCSDPIALAIAGHRRLAGACTSGMIWLATDRSGPGEPNGPRDVPRGQTQ
jgi:hypothetical protein